MKLCKCETMKKEQNQQKKKTIPQNRQNQQKMDEFFFFESITLKYVCFVCDCAALQFSISSTFSEI